MAKKYEDLEEGKIKVINNFKFEDGLLDHSWNTGRICLVLYSDEEYEYMLPITSHINNEKLQKYYFFINEESFMCFYKTKTENTLKRYNSKKLNEKRNVKQIKNNNIEGYINLRYIYKIPVAYRNELGKISKEEYEKIIKQINSIQKTNSKEEIINKALKI